MKIKKWNDLETKLNKPMILADLMLVIDLFIFGICLAYYDNFTNPVNVINLVLEVIEFAFCTFISNRVLNIICIILFAVTFIGMLAFDT